MDQTRFDQLEQTYRESGSAAAIQSLTETLRAQKDWHNLFDALMLQRKAELGLPLSRPSSLQDVPESLRKSVEETYISAAREAGLGFLAQGDIPAAWMYLQVIREPRPVAEALDHVPIDVEDNNLLEQLIQIALYQGVHPVRGLQFLLEGRGTCSTITALDQALPQLSQSQRSDCARIMVRHLYDDLTACVRRHVEQRFPAISPDAGLQELMTGRDWLFEGGNYHIDVSHLGSVVRFARSIEPPAKELEQARQLARYGARLDRQLQYAGEPPFTDFYPAHVHFFNIVLDQKRAEGLQYFRDQLAAEPDERDRPLLAYVLVDLLVRSNQLEEAVELAAEHLSNLNEDVSISFDELCREAGRQDVLRRVRREQGNLVGFVSALMEQPPSAS